MPVKCPRPAVAWTSGGTTSRAWNALIEDFNPDDAMPPTKESEKPVLEALAVVLSAVIREIEDRTCLCKVDESGLNRCYRCCLLSR